jgi:hypothetical protein
MIQKDCPVDFIQVNENQVRLTALWVFILLLIALFAAPFPIFIFLLFDFFLRAFNFGKYSWLTQLSKIVIKNFKIGNKPIDQAPKRFAAKIGFLLSLIITLALFFQFPEFVFSLSLVFAGFAFLESFLGFCAGCYVYTFLQKLKLIR